MPDRQPGEWPAYLRTTTVPRGFKAEPCPAPKPQPQPQPQPAGPIGPVTVPAVRHVAVISLDAHYRTGAEVSDHLRQQLTHIPDGAHVRVIVGHHALALRPLGLHSEIAAAFFLAASIDIEVPGGTRFGGYLAEGVQRDVKRHRQDHARMMAECSGGQL